MNHKHTMSDEEAKDLIAYIKRRCQGINGAYDFFMNPAEVCELVESTLIGIGYDLYWTVGPFSRMLRKEVEKHRHAVLERENHD